MGLYMIRQATGARSAQIENTSSHGQTIFRGTLWLFCLKRAQIASIHRANSSSIDMSRFITWTRTEMTKNLEIYSGRDPTGIANVDSGSAQIKRNF